MDTVFQLLEIASLLVCAYIAWGGLRLFYLTWRLRDGDNIISREFLPLEPVPEALSAIDLEIRDLGFVPQRLIRYKVVYQYQPLTIWTYAHPELDIELALLEASGRPSFNLTMETNFADGALLVTWYPHGHQIETPDLNAHFASHALKNAFDYHLTAMLHDLETHGSTIPIPENDAVYAASAQALNARHGKRLYVQTKKNAIGGGIQRLGIAFGLTGLVLMLQGNLPADVMIGGFPLPSLLLWMAVAIAIVSLGDSYAKRGAKLTPLDADLAPEVDAKVHPLNRPERKT